MRILQVYNRYRTYGGEDVVVDLEADLLRSRGHEVELLTASTGELEDTSILQLAAAGLGTVWSFRGYSLMKKAIERFSPDLVHVHNTFPLLSPSVYWAAHQLNVPVVQTLHNFRFTCANAHLLRDDKACESCVGRSPWPALRYRCFHQSLSQTSAVVAMNMVHRWLGTYENLIAGYIALTEFSRTVLVRAGLPEAKTFVKPNFVPTRMTSDLVRHSQMAFVGAISRAKGAHLLLQAWSRIMPTDSNLVLIGDGPDRVKLQQEYASNPTISWYGVLPHEEVLQTLSESQFLVLPSLCYENFPLVLLEAWSVGTPVVVPDHGAFPSLVSHCQQGMLFSSGDVESLAITLTQALETRDDVWTQWSQSARKKYLAHYTQDANYEQLMYIYSRVVQVAPQTDNVNDDYHQQPCHPLTDSDDAGKRQLSK